MINLYDHTDGTLGSLVFDSSVLDQEMRILYGQHNHHHHHNQKNNSNGSNNNHNNGSSSSSGSGSSSKHNTTNNGESRNADGVLSERSVRPRHDDDDNDVDGMNVMIGNDCDVGRNEAEVEGDGSSGMEVVKDGNIDVVAVSETLDSTIGINNNKKNNNKGCQRQNEKDGETSIVNVRKKKNKSARYDEPIKTNKTLSN